MPIDMKEVKEFEEKYKKLLFEQVEKLYFQQAELLMEIDKMREYMDLQKDLPNIGITLNNKIIQLQHQFENAGISIYSQKAEDYGLAKLNLVMPSFIGQAIIYDLIDYAGSATSKLDDYSKKMDVLTKERNKKVQSLTQTSTLKKFLAKVKSFFYLVKQDDFEYTKEETDEVNSHLLEFRDIDKQLWNYTLKDNMISSIVKHIRNHQYSENVLQGILEENINPDLQKLGLEDLIPQLQQVIIDENKKDLSNDRGIDMIQENNSEIRKEENELEL